jgi:propanediol dehydratase small subunit
MPWPQQYLAGRDQLYRNIERAAQLQERPEANG